ncbi:MAG: hypothetical protein ACYDA6_00225 [Solirubrobacteraceae bacterium]
MAPPSDTQPPEPAAGELATGERRREARAATPLHGPRASRKGGLLARVASGARVLSRPRASLRHAEGLLWTGTVGHLVGGFLDFAEGMARYAHMRITGDRDRGP